MDLLHDVRFAIRGFTRQRSLAVAAIATLALGIGATTAVLATVEGILRRPLDFRGADRIVQIVSHGTNASGPVRSGTLSLPYFVGLRDRAKSLSGVGGYDSFSRVTRQRLAATIIGPNGAMRLLGTRVSPVLFSTLGVQPMLGRAFHPAEEEQDRNRVVILSHRTWQNVYGADENVLGGSFTLDGRIYAIVGVMASDFAFPDSQTDFWLPLTPREIPPSEPRADSPDSYYADGVWARLADGVSEQAASAEVDAILRAIDLELVSQRPAQLREEFRERAAQPRRGEAVGMLAELVAPARPALRLLSLAVGLVLLIACANVANLLLARNAGRQREMAIKAALGANRSRLCRQLLVDSLVLALAGGTVGAVLALWLIAVVVHAAPAGVPRLSEVGIDATILFYVLGLSSITGLLVGFLPAARVLRADALQALTTRLVDAPGLGMARNLIVIGQLACTTVLLVAAGLLIRSFVTLASTAPGFDPRGTITFQVVTPPDHGSDLQQLYGDLLARLEAIPGIAAAGVTDVLPIAGSSSFRLTIPGLPAPPGSGDSMVMRIVSGRYFDAMGIRLGEGRALAPGDRGRTPEPIVVNQEFVRRYFGGQPALGRIVGRDPVWYEVVGVVENVRHAGLHSAAEPEYYVDLGNTALAATIRPYFVVRTTRSSRVTTETSAWAPTIRSVVRQIDPSLGVDLNVKAMTDILSESVTRPRFQALLVTAFAATALMLAAIGVYGVMAYTVEQRTREIGIRMALGAARSTVMWLVLGQGAVVTIAGVSVGLIGAVAVTRYLEAMLFGLTPLDPLTFALGPLTLGIVATLAGLLPARRATKVDPVVALRYE